MKNTLKILDAIFGGLFRSMSKEERKKTEPKIQKSVEENYERILDEELIERNRITQRAKYAQDIIEKDKENFKNKLDIKRKTNDKEFSEIEAELKEALSKGDIELINKATAKLEAME